ncbi:Mannose-6-phosphate isomerase [Kickxella alabastrina]|uniref:Mannose-6-phosphate isomerase n=1 Tax=Kickxella alabastrina TaxID=61397 RepID=A0ACC1IMR0_9FUNG|nr:Mannose-6-phosphate isomerase [Kickxella alabastrina]
MVAIRLSCSVNNYHWGKQGLNSKAAQFAATSNVAIDETKTYSELWMGTHPTGPSLVFGTETPLSAIVDENPRDALGEDIAKKFNNQLPFLFKVLSIDRALSIQAHPDKALAQKLHAERPNVYKDPNHKPEMSIALTDFVAMSGFRPLEQIAAFLENFPEFKALVTESADGFSAAAKSGDDAEKRKWLKALFGELMGADENEVKRQLDTLLERIGTEVGDLLDVSPESLVRRVSAEYPGDVGVFCVFMLNVLKLAPGDAFFMGPNDPHAYVFGDCVECMATSDNVVRAGLTPKMRDVPVLVDMLTYDYGTPDAKLLKPVNFKGAAGHSVIYDPPIDEFSVVRTLLDAGQSETVGGLAGPQILLVVEGRGTLVDEDENHMLIPGAVYFVAPSSPITIFARNSNLVIYTAMCLP